jgi:hypothetical protein
MHVLKPLQKVPEPKEWSFITHHESPIDSQTIVAKPAIKMTNVVIRGRCIHFRLAIHLKVTAAIETNATLLL